MNNKGNSIIKILLIFSISCLIIIFISKLLITNQINKNKILVENEIIINLLQIIEVFNGEPSAFIYNLKVYLKIDYPYLIINKKKNDNIIELIYDKTYNDILNKWLYRLDFNFNKVLDECYYIKNGIGNQIIYE